MARLNSELLTYMLKVQRGKKSLRDVANEIKGVSIATLSRLEQGKTPDVNTLIKVCEYLKIEIQRLIIND